MGTADLNGLAFEPLNQQRARLADIVADALRRQIVSGELGSGTQLLQIQLAERLGVSRTPLREAFRILERDGLVRISNGNKTVEVSHLDISDLLATYEVREVTDGLAARLAATRGLAPDVTARLEAAMAGMESASSNHLSPGKYSEAHAAWHLLLLEASGNNRLEEFARLVRVSSHMLIARHLSEGERVAFDATITGLVEDGNTDHRRIVDLILRHDAAGAERAAIKHISRTTKFARGVLNHRARSARRNHATQA